MRLSDPEFWRPIESRHRQKYGRRTSSATAPFPAAAPRQSKRDTWLPVDPDHLELGAAIEGVLAAVVFDPRRPGRDILRIRRVDVVNLGRGMSLDIVDDLLAGRPRRVAPLGIEEDVEPRVRHVAPVVGLAGAEEVEEIAVHFGEERRWPPGDLVELSEEGPQDVAGIFLVDDGELHADLLEASGQELELLDVVRAIAGPVG